MGSTRFRDPRALSSALAAFGTQQPRAFGSLNRIDPLNSVSNYYLCLIQHTCVHVHVHVTMYLVCMHNG